MAGEKAGRAEQAEANAQKGKQSFLDDVVDSLSAAGWGKVKQKHALRYSPKGKGIKINAYEINRKVRALVKEPIAVVLEDKPNHMRTVYTFLPGVSGVVNEVAQRNNYPARVIEYLPNKR
ncbi:hypothetical protein JXB28_00960 [Candidatus Woesearchaeota archaeon]|nr:hypothetical protein [Candidatus Woesearchaeota archaeon]